jgi:hypothetical protein
MCFKLFFRIDDRRPSDIARWTGCIPDCWPGESKNAFSDIVLIRGPVLSRNLLFKLPVSPSVIVNYVEEQYRIFSGFSIKMNGCQNNGGFGKWVVGEHGKVTFSTPNFLRVRELSYIAFSYKL